MAASENGMLAKVRGLLADGRLGDALRLLQRILAEDPGCSGARRLRGEIAIREGRLQDARADLEAVVGESPDDPSALHALAGVCHGTGDSGAAFAHLQRALELQPDNARLWQALGLQGLELQLNTLGTPDERTPYREQVVAWLRRVRSSGEPVDLDDVDADELLDLGVVGDEVLGLAPVVGRVGRARRQGDEGSGGKEGEPLHGGST